MRGRGIPLLSPSAQSAGGGIARTRSSGPLDQPRHRNALGELHAFALRKPRPTQRLTSSASLVDRCRRRRRRGPAAKAVQALLQRLRQTALAQRLDMAAATLPRSTGAFSRPPDERDGRSARRRRSPCDPSTVRSLGSGALRLARIVARAPLPWRGRSRNPRRPRSGRSSPRRPRPWPARGGRGRKTGRRPAMHRRPAAEIGAKLVVARLGPVGCAEGRGEAARLHRSRPRATASARSRAAGNASTGPPCRTRRRPRASAIASASASVAAIGFSIRTGLPGEAGAAPARGGGRRRRDIERVDDGDVAASSRSDTTSATPRSRRSSSRSPRSGNRLGRLLRPWTA